MLVLKLPSPEAGLRVTDPAVEAELRHFIRLLRYQLRDAVVSFNFHLFARHLAADTPNIAQHRARGHHLAQLAEQIRRERGDDLWTATNTQEDASEAERRLRLEELNAGMPRSWD
jgi:hypothetical protein